MYKDVSELVSADYTIKVKCDDCGCEYEMTFTNRKKRIKEGREYDFCKSCAHSGSRNSQYGKDRKSICIYARTFNKQNPMKDKHHSPETKKLMSDSKIEKIGNGTFNIKSNNRGKKHWYLSKKSNIIFHADSGLELLRMKQLDDDEDVLKWTKHHRLRIPYEYMGVAKNTTPDFFIETKSGIIIEEVKGRITEQELIKKKAVEDYCVKNGYSFSFMTQSHMNRNGEYRKFIKDLKK